MSSPPKYKRAEWRHDRLVQAMQARGLDEFGLRALLNRARLDRGHDIPIQLKTIRNWMEGVTSPMSGRTGFDCQAFEVADALDVSLDWLLGRVDVEPVVPGKRKRGGS